MAQSIFRECKLRVTYETGMNEKGNPIYKTKTYANVLEDATIDQIHEVGAALASLSNYQLAGVEKLDLYELLG